LRSIGRLAAWVQTPQLAMIRAPTRPIKTRKINAPFLPRLMWWIIPSGSVWCGPVRVTFGTFFPKTDCAPAGVRTPARKPEGCEVERKGGFPAFGAFLLFLYYYALSCEQGNRPKQGNRHKAREPQQSMGTAASKGNAASKELAASKGLAASQGLAASKGPAASKQGISLD